MIHLRTSFILVILLGTKAYAQQKPTKQTNGGQCDPTRNRLNVETHKFSSDCDAKTYCSPQGICQPKGCRRDEFPYGYRQDTNFPPMCPSGQFCPDEEDQCLPVMTPGSACQLNRDDQCEPPANSPNLEGELSNHGAMCFNYACQYANITLGQACEVENTVYVGYGPGGSQIPNIISRDRCAPNLWCNAQSGVCQSMVALGQPCSANKQCDTYTCGTSNICIVPPGTPRKIQLWEYIVTGMSILAVMVGTSVGLFIMHTRSRAKKLREIRAYFREQTSYRNSIISMHTHARNRLSTYSLATRHSGVDSLAQFGALSTRESFEEEEDNDQRGLLAGRSLDSHPEDPDSDDEGVGHIHHPHAGASTSAPRPPPKQEGWNSREWGMR